MIGVPYPGLRPFEESDRAIFFGREAQVVAVLGLLQEQQFVAVVGSSGSGKSSLVLAGVLPAVREGFLRETREWKVVVLKPGNDPCGNLSRSLEKNGLAQRVTVAAGARGEGVEAVAERPESLVETLRASDRALLELVAAAPAFAVEREPDFTSSETPDGPHVLLVVDQFEELFTYRRAEAEAEGKAPSFASRDEAANFVRLLLRASTDTAGRIAVIITMRSDFIGDCDAFLELPELVSRCQFLVPRLARSELREAIERPGEVADLGFEPFIFEPGLVNRIIAEAGDRLDQLPLMQHALMRTWKLAGGPSATPEQRVTLTDKNYRDAGRISGALSRHADAAWKVIKRDTDKASLTRRLFLLLGDVQADGKIVRRRPLVSEVQAVTGASLAAIEEIVRCFQADDRNFLLPLLKAHEHLAATDSLDISHEALLRQWKEFAKWLYEEGESKVWLQELSQAAKDYEHDAERTDLWKDNDLRGAEDWQRKAQPNEAWARRHGARNWKACEEFLERSRDHAYRAELHRRRRKQQEWEDAARRQKRLLTGVGIVAGAFVILGMVMTYLWTGRKLSEEKAEQASRDRLGLMQTIGVAVVPTVESGKAAIVEAEQQMAKLSGAIQAAATAAPPEQGAIKDFTSARQAAQRAVDAISKMADSLGQAARSTEDRNLTELAETLQKDMSEVTRRRDALQKNPGVWESVQDSTEARLKRMETALEGLLGRSPIDDALAVLTNKKDKEILAATADLDALQRIRDAAFSLGFEANDFLDFSPRIAAVEKALSAAQGVRQVGSSTAQVPIWRPQPAWQPEHGYPPLTHGGRVNRVRFAPGFPADAPVLVAACEDHEVYFWQKDGKLRGVVAGSSATNDIAFSPQGDALAVASNGSTVRLMRWPSVATLGPFKRSDIKVQAFEKHSDSVTDVDFSHGGERVASASADRTVRVFDSRTMAQLYVTNPPLPGIVTSVAFHRGDNMVVSGCDDGGVRLHTVDETGRTSVQLLGKFDAPARRPEFSTDGDYVVCASADKTARVWSLVAEVLRVDHAAPVTQAAFRPFAVSSGWPFVTTATNGEVRLVRVREVGGTSRRLINDVLGSHSGAALSAVWSADGNWLATVGGGEVIVWQWRGDAPVARLRIVDLHPATSRAEFSPDGTLLVTYGGDHLAYVWDLTKLPAAQP